jgi:hypothetical protein
MIKIPKVVIGDVVYYPEIIGGKNVVIKSNIKSLLLIADNNATIRELYDAASEIVKAGKLDDLALMLGNNKDWNVMEDVWEDHPCLDRIKGNGVLIDTDIRVLSMREYGIRINSDSIVPKCYLDEEGDYGFYYRFLYPARDINGEWIFLLKLNWMPKKNYCADGQEWVKVEWERGIHAIVDEDSDSPRYVYNQLKNQ